MKLLLDTCTFLWIIEGSAKLSTRAKALFSDPGNDVFLSVVSAWEVAQKHAIGKLPLPQGPDRFVRRGREAHGIAALPLDEEAALYVSRLPNLHRDPFDRMLVCQGIVYGLAILTPDADITQYPVRTVW